MDIIKINIEKINALAKTPTYATDGSGCFDLYGTNLFPEQVREGCPVVIGTGLKFDIPEGFGMFVLSRSGHGFKANTRLANCVGFIDSDYLGEVMVKLTADGGDEFSPPLTIQPGDRIAQACILPVPRILFNWVDSLNKQTERGEGGFGSTGR